MIGFGVIGCGSISTAHVNAIKSINDAQLIGCCDIDEEKGIQFSKDNQCEFFKDYKTLINDPKVEVITIATPHYLHKEMAEFALISGKNVISEKPMAINVSDANHILNVASKSSAKYTVCFQNRFNESFIQAKHIVDSNKYGNLKGIKVELSWNRDDKYYNSTDWKGKKSNEGGGVLINQAIHAIDAISWLVGKPVKIKGKIMTSLLEKSIEVEDAAMATGIMKDGARMVIMATNDYSDNPDPVITLNYEKATLTLSMNQLLINGEKLSTISKKSSNAYKDYWGDGHKKLFKAFTDQIKGEKSELIKFLPYEDAIYPTQIVEAIYDSNDENCWSYLN